jgi:AraC-like DNA-binding protein
MSYLDRLSSLLNNFEVRSRRTSRPEASNLFIIGQQHKVEKLVLYIDGVPDKNIYSDVVAFAHVDIGGNTNPLYQAMPPYLEIDLIENSDIKNIAALMATEAKAPRCGGEFALNRLCDLIVVNILRNQIASEISEPGMFAGLAHLKLKNVVVAIHDDPGRNWQIENFTALAGMSRSQFMAEFVSVVGKTPIAYLKHWRMTLAHIAIQKGDRIKDVAGRFGYSSGDAFSRAYLSTYGAAPTKLRYVEPP